MIKLSLKIVTIVTANKAPITLPIASTTYKSFPIRIKKIDSSGNAVTIDGAGAETIDDGLTATLTVQYESIDLGSDLKNWFIL